MASVRLILSDLVLSFMWVWSGALIKIFVFNILGFGFETKGEILKASLSILSMLFFAWLSKITGGGSYNPLTVLLGAVSTDFTEFLFTIGARIPAQVLGSIVGVKYIIETFPEIGHGPRLNVGIHWGALTEGLLTFTIIVISLGVAQNNPSSFFIKNWISSVSKLTLNILGSDLTGGLMNPASAVGWAYARGDHITKEHIFVYWLAPFQATFLGIWSFKLLAQTPKPKEEKISKRIKSE